jgi:hypothetical protein
MEKSIAFFIRIQLKIEFFLNLCYPILKQKMHLGVKIVCGGLI